MLFRSVGERSREGNDLWSEMKESGVLEKTALVFGQMNEPPGARMRVAETGLTMAEYNDLTIHGMLYSINGCDPIANPDDRTNFLFTGYHVIIFDFCFQDGDNLL